MSKPPDTVRVIKDITDPVSIKFTKIRKLKGVETTTEREVRNDNPATLETYAMPVMLAKNLMPLLKIKGFDKEVRYWYISRLPHLNVEGDIKLYCCPYCAKDVSPVEICIDHIIPIKVYTKYKAYLASQRKGKLEKEKMQFYFRKIREEISPANASGEREYGDEREYKFKYEEEGICWQEMFYNAYQFLNDRNWMGTKEKDYLRYLNENKDLFSDRGMAILRKRAANNQENLIACCTDCNSAKSDSLDKTAEYIRKGLNNDQISTEVRDKLLRIKGIYEAMMALPEKIKLHIIRRKKTGIHIVSLKKAISTMTVKESPPSKILFGSAVRKIIFKESFLSFVENLNDSKREPFILKVSVDGMEEETDVSTGENGLIPGGEGVKRNFNEVATDNDGVTDDEDATDENAAVNENAIGDGVIPEDTPKIPAQNKIEKKALRDVLLNEIMIQDRPAYSGFLCFYCLGVYSASAFDIDHINPELKVSDDDQYLKVNISSILNASTNLPLNLLPVCRKCNRTKGDKPLGNEEKNGITLLENLLQTRLASVNRYGFTGGLKENSVGGLTYDLALKKRRDVLADVPVLTVSKADRGSNKYIESFAQEIETAKVKKSPEKD